MPRRVASSGECKRISFPSNRIFHWWAVPLQPGFSSAWISRAVFPDQDINLAPAHIERDIIQRHRTRENLVMFWALRMMSSFHHSTVTGLESRTGVISGMGHSPNVISTGTIRISFRLI
jgi:hypothetical protein